MARDGKGALRAARPAILRDSCGRCLRVIPVSQLTFYSKFGKRSFDVVVSALALVLLALPMGLISLLIRWNLGRPVIFRHRRPGKDGQPFLLMKFRTMLETRDEQGRCLPDAQRQTRLGNFLRSSSLDELPELFNVLRGEMSLVGPRPLMMEYLPRYTPEQRRRHDVAAGITGWAQINGRNLISWEEKFRLDLWYVENQSFLLDLKILLLTVRKVIDREGVSALSHFSSPEFNPEREQGPTLPTPSKATGVDSPV